MLNVELVWRLLDMFAKRDHEAVFAFYDPDIAKPRTSVTRSLASHISRGSTAARQARFEPGIVAVAERRRL
jgi:ketosteroid isomerase-like protein